MELDFFEVRKFLLDSQTNLDEIATLARIFHPIMRKKKERESDAERERERERERGERGTWILDADIFPIKFFNNVD